MDMIPKLGDQAITASNVTIYVSPEDRERALALAHLAKSVAEVIDEETFAEARQIASNLKSMLDEIETGRKGTKIPFTAIGRAVDNMASDIATPVKRAQERILGMLAGYVAQLEAARKERERLEAETRRLAQEEAMRKVREAKNEAEKVQAQLALDLAADVEELGKNEEPPRGLVPGGRVTHDYEFKLVDLKACIDAGCWRLLRWELDILACKDSVKTQVEMQPDVEPSLPGIKITKKLKVSVKAAARVELEDNFHPMDPNLIK